MATVKDIAATVGVSVATVSNVLNGRPNVGRVNRQRVLRVARQLGYRPNRAAQAMRTGRTRAIGLVLPDLTNPFFPELAQAVENTARSPVGPRLPAHLKTLARPVVLIDRPRPGFAVVHSNYVMGGGLLAKYALRMGHTRVGLLSGPQNLESARQRRDGFVNAFPPGGIAWEVNVGFDGLLTLDARDALIRRRNATLIVAGNDLIAISAIRFLAEQGVSVPDEVSITGFDNISWADVVRPRLTTIAQPVGAIGAKAVELMQERMSGAKIATRRTIFDVALVERDSVKHLGHR